MKQILIIVLMTVCSDIYGQVTVSDRKNELPPWAIHSDTNLNWIIAKKQTEIAEKKRIIKSMQSTDCILSGLDTIYNYPIDSLAKTSFLVDINHDNKKDFVLYGLLPVCNFQPFILIAINKGNEFRTIYQHEGDFISWHFTSDTTAFQVFIHGCCADRHGYVYNYSCIKGHESDFYEQLIQSTTATDQANNELNIFWMYHSEFPLKTTLNLNIEIQKDSTILLPFADSLKNTQDYFEKQFNWVFYKGDTGKALDKKMISNETWFYIEMPIKRSNSPNNFRKGRTIYGWIKQENIKIIR